MPTEDPDAGPASGEGDGLTSRGRERNQQNRERAIANSKAWREANPEKMKALQKAWREANKEKVKADRDRWRAENIERSRELNRESSRRVAARRKNEEEQKEKARVRARAWYQQNRERAAAANKAWKAANPEKSKEIKRNYYANNREAIAEREAHKRDENPEKVKADRKERNDRTKDERAEYHRRYIANPDTGPAYKASQAEMARLRDRLKRAGLPQRRVHRNTAAERRQNSAAADQFFTSPETRAWYSQYSTFVVTLDELLTQRGENIRTFAASYLTARQRAGLPAGDVEQAAYARAIQMVKDEGRPMRLLSDADITRAANIVKETQFRRAANAQYQTLVTSLRTRIRKNPEKYRREAQLENRARKIAGKDPIPLDALAHHIAFTHVAETIPLDKLRPEQLRNAVNSVRVSHPTLIDPASVPTITAGTTPPHLSRY